MFPFPFFLFINNRIDGCCFFKTSTTMDRRGCSLRSYADLRSSTVYSPQSRQASPARAILTVYCCWHSRVCQIHHIGSPDVHDGWGVGGRQIEPIAGQPQVWEQPGIQGILGFLQAGIPLVGLLPTCIFSRCQQAGLVAWVCLFMAAHKNSSKMAICDFAKKALQRWLPEVTTLLGLTAWLVLSGSYSRFLIICLS